MQHGRIDEGGKLRLAADDVFRLAAHAIPDRIERGQFRTLRIDLMHCHGLLSQILLFGCYYSTAGGLLSRAGAGQSKPPPDAPHGFISRWSAISGNQAAGVRLLVNFGRPAIRRMLAQMGESQISTQILRRADRCGFAGWLDRRGRHPADVAGRRRCGTAIRCSSGIPAAIWRGGTKAIWCRAAPRCSASICISARIRASGSISGSRRWRRCGSCS